jgi:hypothetical protein
MSTPSLLLVPARLKAGTLFSQIPTNGSGDFTVVQAVGNATRYNSSGFVELAKTNLLQRSEEFENAYWSKANGAVTQNQTIAPNGLTTADKYVVTSGAATNSPIIRSFSFAINTTYTLSLFVKKADYDTASIRLNTTETGLITNFFNLASGTATNNQIQDYGNGWYRVWVSFTTAATVTNGQVQLIRDAQVRDGVAGIFIWGVQLEIGSSPSEYIQTIASQRTRFSGVTVDGTVTANIPRLDYYTSNGTPGCPGLLVEASGTNLALQSENFLTTWSNTSLVITSGFTSPSNNSNGTLIEASANTGRLRQTFAAITSGTTHTFSLFAEAGNLALASGVSLVFQEGTGTNFVSGVVQSFRLDTGTLGASGTLGAGFTLTRASIENYGNGWYRCSMTVTVSYTPASANISIRPTSTIVSNLPATVSGGSAYIYGAQLETGSVATSYIPTTTGTVTRNADVISASGNVSGSIGQTEGSIYVEVDIQKLLGTTQRAFIDIGQTNNRLFLGYGNGLTNKIRFLLQTSAGGLVDFQSAATTTGIIRIAVGYKNNDSAMYVNGVSVSPLSNGSFTATLTTLSNIYLGSSLSAADFLNDKINAVALYGTRLSNDALMLLSMQGNDAYLPQAIWNFYEDSRAGNTEVPTCLYERHADIIDV